MTLKPESLENILYYLCDEDRVASALFQAETQYIIELYDVNKDEARSMFNVCDACDVVAKHDVNTSTFTVRGNK